MQLVYFIYNSHNDLVKIGTSEKLTNRFKLLKGRYGPQIELLGVCEGGRKRESEIHRQFSAYREFGEWFKFVPQLQEFIRDNTYVNKPLEGCKTSGLLAKKIVETIPAMSIIDAILRKAKPLENSLHFYVLGMLEHHSMNISEIAGKSFVSLVTISHSVDLMERQGWITRLRSQEDRRAVLIEITPSGLDARQQTERNATEFINEIFEPFSQSQKQVLSKTLDLLHDVFSKANKDLKYLPHQPD